MTPQASNRIEGGLNSCHGCCRKFRAFPWKELETMKVAQKTAWCADYWRGECQGRGWWWRELYKPPVGRNTQKQHQQREVSLTFCLKIAETRFFTQRYLIRYTHKMFFEDYINFYIFLLVQVLWSYTCSNFGSHICPSAFWFRVNVVT